MRKGPDMTTYRPRSSAQDTGVPNMWARCVMWRPRGSVLLWTAVMAVAVTACSTVDDRMAVEESDITGGVQPQGKALAAVAYLSGFHTNCTATLIAPKLLISAKHCESTSATFFGNTAESFSVEVRRRFDAERSIGGFAGLGLDLTVLELARPVTNIKPLRVAFCRSARERSGRSIRGGRVGWPLEPSSLLQRRPRVGRNVDAPGNSWCPVSAALRLGAVNLRCRGACASRRPVHPLFPESDRRRREAKQLAAFQLE